MSTGTDIQWCDDTRNPVGGCDGCELHNTELGIKYCYAGLLTLRRKGHPGFARDFDVAQMFPGRMAEAARCRDLTGTSRPEKPWLDGYARLIFVSDMGDAMSKDIPFEYLREQIIDVAASPNGLRHIWQWLTKQPQRMASFFKWLAERDILWPTNLWVGTSITSSKNLNRIDHILKVGDASTIRFVSLEPQFEAVTLPHLPSLDWVIQGGLSGSDDYPFELRWARDIRDACAAVGTPYFLKQLGKIATTSGRRFKTRDAHGGDWDEWPADLRVRQMPRLVEGRGGNDPKETGGTQGDTNSDALEPRGSKVSAAEEPPGKTSTHVQGAASPEEEGFDRPKEIPAAILKIGLTMVSRALAGPESREPRLLQLFDTTRPEWTKGEGTLYATDGARGVWFHSTALLGAGFRLHAEDVSEALKFVGTARATHVSGATTLVSETGAEFVGRACKPYPKYQYMSPWHDSHVLRIPRRPLVDALSEAKKRMPPSQTAVRLAVNAARTALLVELGHARAQWKSAEMKVSWHGAELPEFAPQLSIDSALLLVRGVRAADVDLRVVPFPVRAGHEASYGFRTIDEFSMDSAGKLVSAPGRHGAHVYPCRVTRFAPTMGAELPKWEAPSPPSPAPSSLK